MAALIVSIFIAGYLLIALEHFIRINKAATALITGVFCWTVYILFSENKATVNEQLLIHVGDVSGILFFLLGAMTIVELIDAHNGFDVLTRRIHTTSRRALLWIICITAFILSSILDNLTTTIVMVSLIRKLIPDRKDKLLFCGMVIIAANAGGAWSPIGDVSTTILWIGGQITTMGVIKHVLLPSIVCLLVPLIIVHFQLKGNVQAHPKQEIPLSGRVIPERDTNIVFFLGLLFLLLVPLFKTLTHLPPFMGMLFGLAFMWVITERLNSERDTQDKHFLSVMYALRKIDTPSILFFLGILLSVAALQSIHILHAMAVWLESAFKNENLIVVSIGFLSSIVDNVPLVAAAKGMYGLEHYPTDDYFWHFIAYCAGTGGSLLIIGSAAGVAAMGMEKIEFFWYLRKIGWLALLGYLAGAAVFILQHSSVL